MFLYAQGIQGPQGDPGASGRDGPKVCPSAILISDYANAAAFHPQCVGSSLLSEWLTDNTRIISPNVIFLYQSAFRV